METMTSNRKLKSKSALSVASRSSDGLSSLLDDGSNGCCCTSRARARDCLGRHGEVIRGSPWVVLMPISIFMLLIGAGLAIILTTAHSDSTLAEKEAVWQAKESGRWFTSELDRAMLPIFSLAQFAQEIEELEKLPDEIGVAGFAGSVPFIADKTVDGLPTHRDISGSACQDPNVLDLFNRIAANIKEHADMPGVLLNLQLAPLGVVCLIHPLNNTVDFRDGAFLDGTGALGHDLLSDPDRIAGAEATIRTKRPAVVGPLTLKQCDGEDTCTPIAKQAFIARFPIPSLTHRIKISDGQIYERWGFATAIINWWALVEGSNIFEEFKDKNLEFLLTRTDTKCGSTRDSCTQNVVELAKTEGFHGMDSGWLTVTVDLHTTINEWKMTVGYRDPTAWVPWVIAALVVIGLCISILVYFVLYQKKVQSELAAERKAILKKIHSLEKKKKQMELSLKEAHVVMEHKKQAKSTVGFVSSVRKIDRLEEEINDVDRNIEGLSNDMHALETQKQQQATVPSLVKVTSTTAREALRSSSTTTGLTFSQVRELSSDGSTCGDTTLLEV